MQCNLCGNEFHGGTPEQQQKMLQDHIKRSHSQARLDQFQVPPSVRKDIESAKNPPTPVTATVGSKDPEKPPQKITLPPIQPIMLTYKYTGQCPDCRAEVETMDFTVADKLFQIAYCVRCRKKLKEQEVVPIDNGVYPINKFKKK